MIICPPSSEQPKLRSALPAKMDGGTIAGIVIGSVAAFILLIIVLKMGVKVVQEKEVMIVERFGQFHRQLTAGINFLVPFVDRPRVRAG